HLRSDSGSNGLVIKETVTASWSQAHFIFCPSIGFWTSLRRHPTSAPEIQALEGPSGRRNRGTRASKHGHGLQSVTEVCLRSGERGYASGAVRQFPGVNQSQPADRSVQSVAWRKCRPCRRSSPETTVARQAGDQLYSSPGSAAWPARPVLSARCPLVFAARGPADWSSRRRATKAQPAGLLRGWREPPCPAWWASCG